MPKQQLKIVPLHNRANQDRVVAVLETLLERARAGEITGLAGVIMRSPNAPAQGFGVGSLADDPVAALHYLLELSKAYH